MPTPTQPPAPAPVQKTDPSATVVAEHLEAMWRLNQASPAQQAELVQSLRDTADLTPTTSHRLRYALALATPGHGAADPQAARQKLTELLASSETLLPAEQALAWVSLRNVEQRLILQAEIDKLQAEAARRGRERVAASGKRLQAEIEENEKLRKALAEAQAKLDEITRIERQMIERTPPPKQSR